MRTPSSQTARIMGLEMEPLTPPVSRMGTPIPAMIPED